MSSGEAMLCVQKTIMVTVDCYYFFVTAVTITFFFSLELELTKIIWNLLV